MASPRRYQPWAKFASVVFTLGLTLAYNRLLDQFSKPQLFYLVGVIYTVSGCEKPQGGGDVDVGGDGVGDRAISLPLPSSSRFPPHIHVHSLRNNAPSHARHR